MVLVLMGSESDLKVMEETCGILDFLDIPYEVTITSAHRAPKRTVEIAENAMERGIKIIIAGAGGAAHLAGFIAAHTILPVIGVPIDSSPLKGMDALLSTVQMPSGVPVATMAIGRAGAKNAALLAAQILALEDPSLRQRLEAHRQKLARDVEERAEGLRRKRCRRVS